MATDPADELKRLVRRLMHVWDRWVDADSWSGREYDELAAAIETLRRQLEEHEG